MQTAWHKQLADLMSWWKKQRFGRQALLAFKMGLTVLLCLSIGHLLGLRHSYWAAITAIVIMGADNSTTVAAGRDRLIGTLIGAFLGWVTCYVWHGYLSAYALAVALCILICISLGIEKAGRLAAVALTIIVLLRAGETPFRAALGRFVEVSLGIVVALAINLIVPAHSQLTPTVQDK